MQRVRTCVLFGGTGFIGTHLALHMLREELAGQVVLVDLRSPSAEAYAMPLYHGVLAGEVLFRQQDVRQNIPLDLPKESSGLVIDCVGTNRIPGSPPSSHFFTYVRAAQNICSSADAWGCRQIVVTRGIPPCAEGGKQDRHRSGWEARALAEEAAVRVYRRWKAQSPERKLLEVRLGEVYGPGDRGEVAQMVRRAVHGSFFRGGEMARPIPGSYAKELGPMVQLGIEKQWEGGDPVSVWNAWIDPPPILADYIGAIRRAAALDHSDWRAPGPAATCLACSARLLSRVRGREMPASLASWPQRNHCRSRSPHTLQGCYSWKYSLEEAFEDWRRDEPELFAGGRSMRRPIPVRIAPESSPSEPSVI